MSRQPTTTTIVGNNSSVQLDTQRGERVAAAIQESCGSLGIWKRGGLVPIHPIIATRQWADRLASLTRDLANLLVLYSLTRADGDLSVVARAAGLDEDESWKYQLGRPLHDAIGMYRADVLVSGGTPRFLEFNFGTCLNGIASTSLLQRTYADGTHILPETTIDGGETPTVLDARAAWVKRSLQPGQGCGVIGFADEGDEGSLRVFEEDVEALRRIGVRSDFVPAEKATITDAGVEYQGKLYRGALRYFLLGSRYEMSHQGFALSLESASDIKLIGASAYELFTSKLLLADLRCEEGLSRAQQDLVSHIPWTARAIDRRVYRNGEYVEPLRWAQQNRENVVLKPGRGSGSRGILLGAVTPESDWHQALEWAANEGDWVVQERVIGDTLPVAYWDSGSSEVRSLDQPALFGPFIVNGTYAGCYTRHSTAKSEDALIRPERIEFSNCLVATS